VGLESYNLAYKPKQEDDIATIVTALKRDFNAVPKLSDEKKYIIKDSRYLIDILQLGGTISIRIALCCSIEAVTKVFEIFRSLSFSHEGGLYDQHLKMNVREFKDEELEKIKASYRDRQEVFFDHVAFLQDTAISADDLYKYIRAKGIQSRLNQRDPT
jgi:hypothetical protein